LEIIDSFFAVSSLSVFFVEIHHGIPNKVVSTTSRALQRTFEEFIRGCNISRIKYLQFTIRCLFS